MASAAIGQPQGRGRLVPWALLSPAVLLYLFCLVLPLCIILVTSLTRYDATGAGAAGWTLDNYVKILTDWYYRGVLLKTLRVAFITTVATLIIAYPVAYCIHTTTGRIKAYLLLAVLAPLMVSVMVQAFGWLVVLGARGVINVSLLSAGIIASPLSLMYTEGAAIAGMVHAYFPFMVLAILSSFQNMDANLWLAGANLGATPMQVFRRIILPLSLPGVLAGSMIVFCLSASAFVTPAVLGGTRNKLAAYVIWEQILLVLNWPLGAAMGIVLLVLTIAVVLIYQRIVERGRFRVIFEGDRR